MTHEGVLSLLTWHHTFSSLGTYFRRVGHARALMRRHYNMTPNGPWKFNLHDLLLTRLYHLYLEMGVEHKVDLLFLSQNISTSNKKKDKQQQALLNEFLC